MKITAVDQINYLNIGLMVISCALAFVVPFELFLFSYAVLGPLHYLTEISWIHDRGYFAGAAGSRATRLKQGWLMLVGAALAVMLYGVVAEKILHLNVAPTLEIGLFYLAFVGATLLVFAGSMAAAAVAILLAAIGLMMFAGSPYYGLVAFLLITILHVFLFTSAFILFGALKEKSLSGGLSLIVFGLCAASFFVIVPETVGPQAAGYVRASYASFETLNTQLIKLFQLGPGTSLDEIYQSTAGLIVMRFIAFAYTYHYLNWFSKTSVIRWHKISKSRAAVILTLWIGSLLLYARSYELGFVVLYFLSVLHVMLEFPLNHQSFVAIGGELYGLARGARPSASTAAAAKQPPAKAGSKRPAARSPSRPGVAARRRVRRAGS